MSPLLTAHPISARRPPSAIPRRERRLALAARAPHPHLPFFNSRSLPKRVHPNQSPTRSPPAPHPLGGCPLMGPGATGGEPPPIEVGNAPRSADASALPIAATWRPGAAIAARGRPPHHPTPTLHLGRDLQRRARNHCAGTCDAEAASVFAARHPGPAPPPPAPPHRSRFPQDQRRRWRGTSRLSAPLLRWMMWRLFSGGGGDT